jgi:hypothetical protein
MANSSLFQCRLGQSALQGVQVQIFVSGTWEQCSKCKFQILKSHGIWKHLIFKCVRGPRVLQKISNWEEYVHTFKANPPVYQRVTPQPLFRERTVHKGKLWGLQTVSQSCEMRDATDDSLREVCHYLAGLQLFCTSTTTITFTSTKLNMADVAVDTAVDGAETTSKNALKKQQKAEEAAKKKAAKDEEKKAKKASEPEKATKIGGDDAEELDPTQYYDNRIKAITNMEVFIITPLLESTLQTEFVVYV